ncbi:MAG TPA: diguanylate cyclase [Burkholderiales bacterium]|nr:diguanylate cyclase [Burkholderiales bacterium]
MTKVKRTQNNALSSVQQDLLADALAKVANAIFITDSRGFIVWSNSAFWQLSGYSEQEVLGRKASFLKSGRQDPRFYKEMWETICSGRVWRGKMVERRKDGALFVVEEIITPLMDETGNVTHFIAIQHDLTSREKEIERTHFLAYHDSLTGLANRELLLKFLEDAVSVAQRAGRLVGILFLDMDGFKNVNDRLGHRVGDRLLKAIAERLNASVRKTDMVARLGGDEFVIVQTDIENPQAAQALGEKLVTRIGQSYNFYGVKVNIKTSVGIALYPKDGNDPERLLAFADRAMYEAKKAGGNGYRFFDTQYTV